jgi:hypothetical protein
MRRTLWRAISVVLVVGVTLLGCTGGGPNRRQNPSSASGFNIDVEITPNVLRGATPGTNEAQGGCAQVTAKVFDELGQLVDGAFVNMTTTLGRFPGPNPGQEFVSVGGPTIRGIFDFPICAKAERGTGTITATVEDAVATTVFTVF